MGGGRWTSSVNSRPRSRLAPLRPPHPPPRPPLAPLPSPPPSPPPSTPSHRSRLPAIHTPLLHAIRHKPPRPVHRKRKTPHLRHLLPPQIRPRLEFRRLHKR